ncbi:hypothetical protein ACNKHM_22905 [Shigella sonnei]
MMVSGRWSLINLLLGANRDQLVGENGKVLYAKGANVTSDKGIIDFLNQYEEAVKVYSVFAARDDHEAVQTAKQSDGGGGVVGEAEGMAHELSVVPIPRFRKANVIIAALKATGCAVLVLMNRLSAGAGERRLAG